MQLFKQKSWLVVVGVLANDGKGSAKEFSQEWFGMCLMQGQHALTENHKFFSTVSLE